MHDFLHVEHLLLDLPDLPSDFKYCVNIVNTVLSGAEERGVNGPSLDRSYFSRLQPSRSYFSIHLRVTLLSL